jgi:hypothetical protein
MASAKIAAPFTDGIEFSSPFVFWNNARQGRDIVVGSGWDPTHTRVHRHWPSFIVEGILYFCLQPPRTKDGQVVAIRA